MTSFLSNVFILYSFEDEARQAASIIQQKTGQQWVAVPYDQNGRKKWTIRRVS